MFKVISLAAILIALAGCASTPEKSGGNPDSRAKNAAEEMDQDPGSSREGTIKIGQGGKEPPWVSAPDSVYPKNAFIAATGYGGDRDAAEKDSLAKLIAIFGQSIQADLETIHKYSETVSRGKVEVSQDTKVQNAIKTSSAMDTLMGAEIREVWFDNRTTYYAVATLEKAKARTLYTDLINANQQFIDQMLVMSDLEKYSLDGYARYQLAATIADANYAYANVLTIVADMKNDCKKGDAFRLEAVNITKNIPIAIQVAGDRSDRIKDAFAGVIAKQGFRTGGTNSRYVLRVKVTLEPVELPNQPNKFVRYVVEANFVDTLENSVIIPFNLSGREGHTSASEADNRAVAVVEKKIGNDYGGHLADHLAQLMPAKK